MKDPAPTREVAARLGISPSTVLKRARRLGITPVRQGPGHAWPNSVLVLLATPRTKVWLDLQIERFDAELARFGVSPDGLVSLAIQSMHALNRAAKHSWSNDTIYRHKDALCDVLLASGRAALFTFEWPTIVAWTCVRCGRRWEGRTGGRCFLCRDKALPEVLARRWWIVEAEGYRFHRPSVPDKLAGLAQPCEAHDPTQQRRVVPEVLGPGGTPLVQAVQLECVRRAVVLLGGEVPPPG